MTSSHLVGMYAVLVKSFHAVTQTCWKKNIPKMNKRKKITCFLITKSIQRYNFCTRIVVFPRKYYSKYYTTLTK